MNLETQFRESVEDTLYQNDAIHDRFNKKEKDENGKFVSHNTNQMPKNKYKQGTKSFRNRQLTSNQRYRNIFHKRSPTSARNAAAHIAPEISSRLDTEQRLTTLATLNLNHLWSSSIPLSHAGGVRKRLAHFKDTSQQFTHHVQILRRSTSSLLQFPRVRSAVWWSRNVIAPWTNLECDLFEANSEQHRDAKTMLHDLLHSDEALYLGLQYFECRLALETIIQLYDVVLRVVLPLDTYISFWDARIDQPYLELIEQGPFHWLNPLIFWKQFDYQSPASKVIALRRFRSPLLHLLGHLRRLLIEFASANNISTTRDTAHRSLEVIREALLSHIPDIEATLQDINANKSSSQPDSPSSTTSMATLDSFGLFMSDHELDMLDLNNAQNDSHNEKDLNRKSLYADRLDESLETEHHYLVDHRNIWDAKTESMSGRQRVALLVKLLEAIPTYSSNVNSAAAPYRPRGLLRRNWLKVAVTTSVVVFSARQIWRNRNNLLLLATNARNGVVAFYREHLKGPVDTIWSEIFQGQRTQVADVNAIKDAKESLQNMLQNILATRHANGLLKIPQQNITAIAKAMDMSYISRAYEHEIQYPIYYGIQGDLLQLMLIQIQFIKKEILNSMQAMDEIRGQQNMNIQLMALIPAILFTYLMAIVTRRVYVRMKDALEPVKRAIGLQALWERFQNRLSSESPEWILNDKDLQGRLRWVLRDIDRLVHIALVSYESHQARLAHAFNTNDDSNQYDTLQQRTPKPISSHERFTSPSYRSSENNTQANGNAAVDPYILASRITSERDNSLHGGQLNPGHAFTHNTTRAGYDTIQSTHSPIPNHLSNMDRVSLRNDNSNRRSRRRFRKSCNIHANYNLNHELTFEQLGELAVQLHRLWSLLQHQKRYITLEEWIRLCQDVQDLVTAVDAFPLLPTENDLLYGNETQNVTNISIDGDEKIKYHSFSRGPMELASNAIQRLRATYPCFSATAEAQKGWFDVMLRKLL